MNDFDQSVSEAIKRYRKKGVTLADLCADTRMPYQSVSSACSRLRRAGIIKPVGRAVSKETGYEARVWCHSRFAKTELVEAPKVIDRRTPAKGKPVCAYDREVLAHLAYRGRPTTVIDLCTASGLRISSVPKSMTTLARAGLVKQVGMLRSESTGHLGKAWQVAA